MKSSYLIQRLQKPSINKDGSVFINPFSFGGGLVSGGLSKDAMELLRNIFEFDYMGAAEYEFGAVPEALQAIAENVKDYIAFSTKVKYQYKNYCLFSKPAKESQISKGTVEIFVICYKDWKDEVVDRITAKAAGEYGKRKNSFSTKAGVGLDRSLGGTEESDKRIVGWFELDNGYFFFKDKEMFDKTIEFLGVKHEDNNASRTTRKR